MIAPVATNSITSVADSGRISKRFAALKAEGRGGLVTFITAGDPDADTFRELLSGLPNAGADVIELGIPFSDPMADGPAIQAASIRALKAGTNLRTTLDHIREFRKSDDNTPVILMGYFNPIYKYGVEKFLDDFKGSGADGLIIVDLPPEEDLELCIPALKAGVNFIRLATPTTDDARLPAVLKNTSGFVYYVSILGITGTDSAGSDDIRFAVERLKRHTDLPVAVGFGINSADAVRDIGSIADAVVVGSAIVNRIAANLDNDNRSKPGLVDHVLSFVRELASGVRG